jgi:hypothetical protein
MESGDYKSSLYCWIILFIFIIITLIFMINFYNKVVADISKNYATVNLENYVE